MLSGPPHSWHITGIIERAVTPMPAPWQLQRRGQTAHLAVNVTPYSYLAALLILQSQSAVASGQTCRLLPGCGWPLTRLLAWHDSLWKNEGGRAVTKVRKRNST